MLKKYTCIICPNGCEIEAEVLDGEIKSVSGFTCKRGEEYVRQEILAPKRTIASSVAVKNGELPVTSVRITKAVPKELIPEVMKEIKKQGRDSAGGSRNSFNLQYMWNRQRCNLY